jgi:alpha-tubulin suppressor-like RCC1 family protein
MALSVVVGSMLAQTTASATEPIVAAWGSAAQISIPTNLTDVQQVACGYQHSYALKKDGTVIGWGANSYQQLDTPVGLTDVTQIACGFGHTYARLANGSIVGWGWNTAGQISTPTNLGSVIQMSLGNQHSVALKADGSLRAWGRSDNGELQIPAGLNNCTQVASGAHHSYALKQDGSLVGWGLNDYLQTQTPQSLPSTSQVACGYHFTCALLTDHSVRAWGRSDLGQGSVPTDLRASKLACGAYHAYAIRLDGSPVSWGLNDAGQTATPAAAAAVTDIACGFQHTCAIVADPIAISRVQPISGPSGGGTVITISGSNFKPNSIVKVNGIPATDVAVLSSSTITATTPASFPGEATVTVDYCSEIAFYYRPYCGSDLDQDGEVTAADISIVLLDFGPCYQTPLAAPAPEVPPLLEAQALPDAPRQR